MIFEQQMLILNNLIAQVRTCRHLCLTEGPAEELYTSYRTPNSVLINPDASPQFSASTSARESLLTRQCPAAPVAGASGLGLRCAGRAVPVSSLICCMELKSIA